MTLTMADLPSSRRRIRGVAQDYSIGALTRLEGIAAGIENTNYFVTTTHGR